MKARLAAVLGLVPLVIMAIAIWQWQKPEHKNAALLLQGNVDVRQSDLSFKVAGRIVEMAVQEGDKVAAGQVLARLERPDFEAALQQAQGQVAAQAATLSELENGSRPEEIDQARASVDQDEAALVNARLTYKRQQQLLKDDFTPHANFDLAQANLRQAEAQLATAKAALTLAVKGPRQERIDAARGQLDQVKGALALAQQHLADTELTTPEDGVVLSRVREPGTIAGAGETVYSVVLTHPTWVRAYVAEPDLGRVHPGQNAEIVTDGGQKFQGQVGYISPLAEFTPKTVQTAEQRTELVYRLRLSVDNKDDGLRQGMPVTVRLADR